MFHAGRWWYYIRVLVHKSRLSRVKSRIIVPTQRNVAGILGAVVKSRALFPLRVTEGRLKERSSSLRYTDLHSPIFSLIKNFRSLRRRRNELLKGGCNSASSPVHAVLQSSDYTNVHRQKYRDVGKLVMKHTCPRSTALVSIARAV